MVMFWIVTLLIILVSALLIVVPLTRHKVANDAQRRDELNKAIYKERVAELKVEDDEGIVANKDELITDLKQSLLDDIPEQQELAAKHLKSPWLVAIVSAVLLVGISYGFYAKFGAISEVAHWQQVSANLPTLSKKLMDPNSEGMSDEEMADLTLALRTSLHRNSKDATGWLLLGRIGLANRDVQTAIGAMERARKLKPQDPDIQLGLAQALTMSPDEVDHDQATRILKSLLQRNYVDVRVLSLLAFSAYEKQDYAGAIKYWRGMQQMIGPDDNRYEMLGRSIANAQKAMGQSSDETLSEQMPAASGAVTIQLSVAEGITLPKDAALIVSIHRADGSPMPIAAARYGLGSFPRTVVMDDGNSMIEGQKLSSLDQFIVRARIDTDGNVGTRDGDWYGESKVTPKGGQATLQINQRY
ncbi:c-type cytochrome biogenesis protein CcmI [Vibrio gallicus]|uniref:c-type cytochrome biogenesis protein CcmI n=1 Tax=Vibrio gallicus TaxID=190897 RepID=UPI0021C45F5E|nr:c-type cytochrome biogenesis protein CcmI [Vibrio gallicus]